MVRSRGAVLTRRRGALPNLIVIGAMRAGTTSLHHYLGLHPEIQMSSPKELRFFSTKPISPREVAWYASHFDPRAPVRGESSPEYTSYPRWPDSPAKMRSLVPDARLIYVVRDPIERMVSAYLFRRALDLERREARDALLHGTYADLSRYGMQLERYLAHYPPERILVVDSDELRMHRAETLASVFRFVGVEESFSSADFDRLWNRTAPANRMRRAIRWPVLRGVSRLPIPHRARWLVERTAQPSAGAASADFELEPGLREALVARVVEDADRLRELTGRRFDGWSV